MIINIDLKIEVEPQAVDLGICTARKRDIYRCSRPAVVSGYSVCVHEHMSNVAHCAVHRLNPPTVWVCGDCHKAGHHCQMKVQYNS